MSKSGRIPYLSFAAVLVGVLANLFIFCWCVHVMRLYNAGPIENTNTILNPIWAGVWVALLIGLPLSLAGNPKAHKVLTWLAVGVNVLSVPLACVFGTLTALAWEL